MNLDDDGYPEEEDLQKIRVWGHDDFAGLLAFCQAGWRYPDYFTNCKNGTFLISTGGWSGNEDIVSALQENRVFWTLCWFQSQRGGHYIFKLPQDLAQTQER